MLKAIFVTAILFIIQMVMMINACKNNQKVNQDNSNDASSDASAINDNAQQGLIDGSGGSA